MDQTGRLRKEEMHDIWFCCTAFPFCGGITLCGRNTSDMERTVILSVAVLAIIIAAPLGAIGMDAAYQRLLEKEN